MIDVPDVEVVDNESEMDCEGAPVPVFNEGVGVLDGSAWPAVCETNVVVLVDEDCNEVVSVEILELGRSLEPPSPCSGAIFHLL